MAYKIQIRRDTATNWTNVNPTLGQGELGYETSSGKLKVGDGVKTWAQLDYLIGENDGSIDLGAVDKHVLPATDNVYDLGSPTKQWRELYVSGGSIYVGDIKISNQAGRLIFTQVTNPGQINEAPVPGGTEAFELPVASDTLLGAVKIGDNLTITEDGTLNAQQGDYELPTASNVVKGGILIGDNLTIDGEGYLSATIPDVSNFITAEDVPAIPADISDLTDTTNLLGSGSDDVGNFTFNETTMTLPAGGTVTETVVTDNPTIVIQPAEAEAESQALFIKGGAANFSNTENDITVSFEFLTYAQGDTVTIFVYAPALTSTTLYWWVDNYSPDTKFTPDTGELITDEFGNASFEFVVNDATVPFRVYVADTLYNAYANNLGAASLEMNGTGGNGNIDTSLHLHLTTGDLTETSIFLGTDNHNVRTKADGGIELTSYDYDNEETYKLTFKNRTLSIDGTVNPGDTDLFIKAGDDLYLDALNDDIHFRASDDVRIQPGYNFDTGEYAWQYRFVEGSGALTIGDYNNQYGGIYPIFDDINNDRSLSLESENSTYIKSQFGTQIWKFGSDGSLTFPDATVQTTASAGGVGRALMIDTNRTDSYIENGSADRPFKSFVSALSAANALASAVGAPAGDKRFTFILMGCTVTENVDFSGTKFTAITISTTCRSVITGNVTIGIMPDLSQVVMRNIEIGGTLTITGDGTEEQMNNVSFYNTSFSGAVNITATNAAAFYEVAFFGAVTFTNISYFYINGAQFNTDWTIRADDTGFYPIPSRGINPNTGGSVSIVFSVIANNVIFVKGGTAAFVFQPHMSRMGLGAGTYTVPAGWTMTPHSTVLRGTWVNNGAISMRNSSSDNTIGGTTPTYTGTIGGAAVKFNNGTTQTTAWPGSVAYNDVPVEYLRLPEPDTLVITPNPTSAGTKGQVIYSAGFVYICVATNTWVRASAETTWE